MALHGHRGDADPTSSEGSVTPSVNEGWTVLSHLLSGIFVFGGLGWGLDALLGTRWFLLVGLLAGGAASFALIYIRYVYIPPQPLPRPSGPAGPQERKEHG